MSATVRNGWAAATLESFADSNVDPLEFERLGEFDDYFCEFCPTLDGIVDFRYTDNVSSNFCRRAADWRSYRINVNSGAFICDDCLSLYREFISSSNRKWRGRSVPRSRTPRRRSVP